MKDAKRIREKIFGRTEKDLGYIKQILKRHEYMEKNYKRVLKVLKWQFDEVIDIKVISIFVSRHDYWWTRFPSAELNLSFTRVDLLSHLISEKM